MSSIVLKFLWSEKNLGVCLDQRVGGDQFSPLTEYFFWPQNDSWEEIQTFVEANKWVDQKESVLILNRLTDVINFWQENTKLDIKNMDSVRSKFPDCFFLGYR